MQSTPAVEARREASLSRETHLILRACSRLLVRSQKRPWVLPLIGLLCAACWSLSAYRAVGWMGPLVICAVFPFLVLAGTWLLVRRDGRSALVDDLTIDDSEACRVTLVGARLLSVEDHGAQTSVVVGYDSISAVGLDADARPVRQFRRPEDLLANPLRLNKLRLGAGGIIDARIVQAGGVPGIVEVYGIEDTSESERDVWSVTWEQVVFRFPEWTLSV